MRTLFNNFVAAEFPKTPSPKPARIPPQTPPAGGKSAEAGRIHIPSQMFRPAERQNPEAMLPSGSKNSESSYWWT